MSYEMWFWKQTQECPHDPGTITCRASEGGELAGLEKLDFEAIRKRLSNVFPDFSGGNYACENSYFTIDDYPPFVFQIVSSFPNSDEVTDMLNKIIDVASEFECKLYDPQTGVRYE